EVLLGLLEPRAEILEYLVEASAKRANDEDLDRIEESIEALEAAEKAKDEIAFVDAQHRWLNALVDSTHNLAFRWVANPFLESIRDMMWRAKGLILFEPSLAAMAYEVLDRARRGDAEGARAVTRDFHHTVDEKLRMILEPAAKKESAT
ncbi:MAG: FCD domain-containing protein, partial [Sandaracinaceae bacterium]|nr:FCD domain-containing protein [Sandaracinaceae bacterium]